MITDTLKSSSVHMSRLIALACFTVLLLSSPAHARKVAGVELESSLAVGSEELILNGAGLRKRLFIKLYVGSLYLGSHSNDAAGVIAADESMAIRLNILSDLLTRDKMLKALKSGFNKSTGGNTGPVQPQIDQMIELMTDKIRPGDSYTFAFEPAVGTRMSRNGEELGLIEGLEFKQALFGIWLSDKPVQANLKSAMLKGG